MVRSSSPVLLWAVGVTGVVGRHVAPVLFAMFGVGALVQVLGADAPEPLAWPFGAMAVLQVTYKVAATLPPEGPR